MLVLSLPRDLVEAAFPAVERGLERRPEAWTHLAARGKLRRFLGDRGGLDDLRTAAETYLRLMRAPSLQTPANLYRLAGDPRGVALLEQLRDELRAEPVTSSTGTGMLVDTCFLLGDDAGAQEALAAMERDRRGLAGLRHRDVARLAAGRATGDVALVDEALVFFERMAHRDRKSFAGTGGMNAHDWLEIALVTRVQVSGEPSDRLFEL